MIKRLPLYLVAVALIPGVSYLVAVALIPGVSGWDYKSRSLVYE